MNPCRSGFAYEAHLDGLKSHFKNLMGDQNSASYGRLVEALASNRMPGCRDMVCDLVYEQLVTEHKVRLLDL